MLAFNDKLTRSSKSNRSPILFSNSEIPTSESKTAYKCEFNNSSLIKSILAGLTTPATISFGLSK